GAFRGQSSDERSSSRALQGVRFALVCFPQLLCKPSISLYAVCGGQMPRKRPYRAITSIDPAELAAFQAGIRRPYSAEDILEQLRACAERLGRSPTMKEFGDDPETTVHPQTVIEHFGTWNKAKRAAGMVPRRFATREELLGLLQELGRRLGRVPTAKDVDAN